MKQKRISVYTDLLFCIVILPVIIMLAPVEKWIVYHTTFMILLITYLYALYFAYRKINLPSLLLERKYTKAAITIVTVLVVTILISKFPLPESNFFSDQELSENLTNARRRHREQTVWYFFFIVTGFTLAIELVFELFKQIISKQEIEAEKNKAELALYKSQIDPHFMFNTLNAIYGLVVSKSELAESAFIKFSNILKYLYSQTGTDKVSIRSEVDYINQYIDLLKLRLNSHTRINLTCDISDDTILMPSMILITFVENAFKYGTSPEEDCSIDISIREKDGELGFSTKNRIIRRKLSEHPPIGIRNCRMRLDLLYPDRYTLKNREKDGYYLVDLNITLRQK